MAGICIILINLALITEGQVIIIDREYDDNANGGTGFGVGQTSTGGVDKGITYDANYKNGTYFIGPLAGGIPSDCCTPPIPHSWWIQRSFKCSEYAESMHVSMIHYWCGASSGGDYLTLWMTGLPQTNAGGSDSDVPDGYLTGSPLDSSCTGWKYIKKDYSTNGIYGTPANYDSVGIQIQVSLAGGSEWFAVSHIKVKCDYGQTNAPTNEPTNSPTTSKPTKFPTNQPTQDPTRDPTYQPTAYPTTEPTAQPTIELT